MDGMQRYLRLFQHAEIAYIEEVEILVLKVPVEVADRGN
jgi:hypothetical protein